MQPDHQHLNAYLMGGRRHVLPGNEVIVVPTELGRMGLLICSELWVPELFRLLMLRGADMVIAPMNGAWRKSHMNLFEAWHAMVRTRARETVLSGISLIRRCEIFTVKNLLDLVVATGLKFATFVTTSGPAGTSSLEAPLWPPRCGPARYPPAASAAAFVLRFYIPVLLRKAQAFSLSLWPSPL
jgi:hypothetical protein